MHFPMIVKSDHRKKNIERKEFNQRVRSFFFFFFDGFITNICPLNELNDQRWETKNKLPGWKILKILKRKTPSANILAFDHPQGVSWIPHKCVCFIFTLISLLWVIVSFAGKNMPRNDLPSKERTHPLTFDPNRALFVTTFFLFSQKMWRRRWLFSSAFSFSILPWRT